MLLGSTADLSGADVAMADDIDDLWASGRRCVTDCWMGELPICTVLDLPRNSYFRSLQAQLTISGSTGSHRKSLVDECIIFSTSLY